LYKHVEHDVLGFNELHAKHDIPSSQSAFVNRPQMICMLIWQHTCLS